MQLKEEFLMCESLETTSEVTDHRKKWITLSTK